MDDITVQFAVTLTDDQADILRGDFMAQTEAARTAWRENRAAELRAAPELTIITL